jgi:hypothetical protein
MGRGLSDLQKTILRLALAEHDAWEGREYGDRTRGGTPRSHVARWQVLAEHYGFRGHERFMTCRPAFDPETIGRAKYKSAVTAVGRAIKRLVERGLLATSKIPHYRKVRKHSQGSWRRFGPLTEDRVFECPRVQEQSFVTYIIRLTDDGIRAARSLPVYRLASRTNWSRKPTISLEEAEAITGRIRRAIG